jgi:menaquinone-9 beta-reductase
MQADVIISGAGPAGSLAATVLARGGARVILLDRARFPRHKLCGDTLNPGGVSLLRSLGLAGPVERHGVPLEGMVVTSVTGVRIRGVYGGGLVGRAWARSHLDAHLLEAAARAGADVRVAVRVVGPATDRRGRVTGVRVQGPDGEQVLHARWTIAADGRRSPLALALGLIRHPARPRRWAFGTYAQGVDGLEAVGEMHVRSGHYIGVAPAGGDVANLCVVTSRPVGMRDPAALLWDLISADPLLRARCATARQVAPIVTLGPLAVDACAVGVPGLLLAGDAAGFVDPMTGDGLHLALRGGHLAADVLLRGGGVDDHAVLQELARRRREAFGDKLRFNRLLRTLVGWPMGVRLGALGAAMAPGLLRRVIATAGDVGRCPQGTFAA